MTANKQQKNHRKFLKQGIRDALVGPLWLLGFSMTGFGALVRSNQFDWFFGPVNTATAFALPGQVILVEMFAPGVSLFAVWLAVSASSVRMLPMVVVFFAAIRPKNLPLWKQLILAQIVAITVWVNVLGKKATLERKHLWPYAIGFGLAMYLGVLPFGVIGYFLGDVIPREFALGFIMFMPVYFIVLFSAEWKHTGRILAICLGFILGPLLYRFSADRGMLLAGLAAGTAAFFIEKAIRAFFPEKPSLSDSPLSDLPREP